MDANEKAILIMIVIRFTDTVKITTFIKELPNIICQSIEHMSNIARWRVAV